MNMKSRSVWILTKYRVIFLMFSIVVLINCRGFRLLLPKSLHYIHMHIYRVCTILSIVIIYYENKRSQKHYRTTLIYLGNLIFLFLFPQWVYTTFIYNQTLVDFFLAVDQYFFLIWVIPLLYVFYRDRKIDKMISMLSILVTVGYVVLIINVILKNTFNISFFQIEEWNWRNGSIRIPDSSSFAALAMLYYWIRFLNTSKQSLLSCLIIGTGYIYVERSRAATIAILVSMLSVFLFKQRKSISKAYMWILTLAGIIVALFGGILSQYLSQFSLENNGASTSNRILELRFYLEKFVEHKFLGIGTLLNENLYSIMGISANGNMNYEDIGIFGMLGMVGIVGVTILYIIPLLRWGYILIKIRRKKELQQHFLLMLGLFVYIIVTSPTLIFLNYQRMPLLPFIWAIYEFVYAKYKESRAQLVS